VFGGSGVLLIDLKFALTIDVSKSAEKGPGATLDMLGMLMDKLTVRLEVPQPREEVEGPQPGT
jgi:hypothetical protein